MASAPETERLFFALWPDAALRQRLYKETRRAVRTSGGRPVPAENFHITLVFLGSVDSAGAVAAREAAGTVASECFELVLDRLGFWPEPRVVWCGASVTPEPARRLAAQLAAALRACGLSPDPQPFVPHVTLARKVAKPGELGRMSALRWPSSEFALVRSVTHTRGSEYQALAFWPFARRAAVPEEL